MSAAFASPKCAPQSGPTLALPPPGGVISEFVNPKYADATRTAFKSSTRLECMMQDYPKALGKGAKVGFTVVNQARAHLAALLCV